MSSTIEIEAVNTIPEYHTVIEAVGTSDQIRFRLSVHIEPFAGCRYYYCESHGDGYSAETKRRLPVIDRYIPYFRKILFRRESSYFFVGRRWR